MSVECVNDSFTQTLGRSTWYLIHATAWNVKSTLDCNNFKTLMRSIIYSYPCEKCQHNILTRFKEELDKLDGICCTRKHSANYEAVIWASKLHALVSLDIQSSKTGFVSKKSIQYARVCATQTDDEVYEMNKSD